MGVATEAMNAIRYGLRGVQPRARASPTKAVARGRCRIVTLLWDVVIEAVFTKPDVA